MPLTPATEPCQGRQAVHQAQAHVAAGEAATQQLEDIHLGLRQFTDTFVDAVAGDFLAESDERRLRDKYRTQPAALRRHLARNGRALGAQRALHVLYNKLLAGAAISAEERALAEHAQDLCQDYAGREAGRRGIETSA